MSRRRMRTILHVLLGVVTLARVAHAGGLAPARASQTVMLLASGTSAACAGFLEFDTAIGPDGTQTPFNVPSGKRLVVTGVSGTVGSTAGCSNTVEAIGLLVAQNAGALSTVAFIPVPIGSPNARSAFNVPLGNVTVRSGHALCLSGGGQCFGLGDVSATLEGFLVKDN